MVNLIEGTSKSFKTTDFQEHVTRVVLRREIRSRLGWQDTGKQLRRFGPVVFRHTFQPGSDFTYVNCYLLVCLVLMGVWVPIVISRLLH
jgi:hypothetical protein